MVKCIRQVKKEVLIPGGKAVNTHTKHNCSETLKASGELVSVALTKERFKKVVVFAQQILFPFRVMPSFVLCTFYASLRNNCVCIEKG